MYLSQHVRSYDSNTYLVPTNALHYIPRSTYYLTTVNQLLCPRKWLMKYGHMSVRLIPVGDVYIQHCIVHVVIVVYSARYRRRLHATLSSIDMLSD